MKSDIEIFVIYSVTCLHLFARDSITHHDFRWASNSAYYYYYLLARKANGVSLKTWLDFREGLSHLGRLRITPQCNQASPAGLIIMGLESKKLLIQIPKYIKSPVD